MWDTVGIVAAVVVIIFMFQILDVTDALKDRIRGRTPRADLEARLEVLEKRISEMEKRGG